MNKKGIVRIIEAFFAVLIIAGALIFVYTSQIKKVDESASILNIEKIILDKISYEDDLREAVLNSYLHFDETIETNFKDYNDIVARNSQIASYNQLNDTITDLLTNSKVLENYEFRFRVCELNEICGLEHSASTYTKYEIYASEKSISSSLETYGPRKIRLFIWRKD